MNVITRYFGCKLLALRLASGALCLLLAPAVFAAELYTVSCPAGSYLVGFEGRAGAWLDRVTPVCAAWVPTEGKLDAPRPLRDQAIGESGGGDPVSRLCPAGWAVGGHYTIFSARDPRVVHSIEFTCLPIDGDTSQAVPRSFGSKSEGATVDHIDTLFVGEGCPTGTLASGIKGISGLFVDTLFLTCSEAKLVKSKPLGKLRSPPPSALSTTVDGASMKSIQAPRAKPLGKVGSAPPAAKEDPVICQRARAARGKVNPTTQAALDAQCRNAGGTPD